MKILGISAHYHDSAAALVIDGLPVAVVQEERLSRRKNDAAFPMLAIEWCLAHAGVQPEALDAVVFYERPMLKFDRILTSTLRTFPRSWRAFPKAMKNALGERVWGYEASSHRIWACRAARSCLPSITNPTLRRPSSRHRPAGPPF
jgi:carbamoyltransferase